MEHMEKKHKKKMKKMIGGSNMSTENSDMIVEEMGHEMKVNPPKALAKTKKKFGAKRAEKQRKAILLSKARKAGAKIKRRK